MCTCWVRKGHSYVTYTDDVLLGGQDSSYSNRNDIWKYDANRKKWERVGRMSDARYYHAVSTISNKELAQYCDN